MGKRKDFSRMDRAIIRRDKKMFDSRGNGRYVPFNQWKSEVINNPTGPTANRAVKNKDPDLKKLTIDVIGINHGKTKDTKVTPLSDAKGSRRIDLTGSTLSAEQAKRMGFRRAEEGKTNTSRRVKDEKNKDD